MAIPYRPAPISLQATGGRPRFALPLVPQPSDVLRGVAIATACGASERRQLRRLSCDAGLRSVAHARFAMSGDDSRGLVAARPSQSSPEPLAAFFGTEFSHDGRFWVSWTKAVNHGFAGVCTAGGASRSGIIAPRCAGGGRRLSTETIAVIGGTGNIGYGLALRWAEKGHRVLIGSRAADRAEAPRTSSGRSSRKAGARARSRGS